MHNFHIFTINHHTSPTYLISRHLHRRLKQDPRDGFSARGRGQRPRVRPIGDLARQQLGRVYWLDHGDFVPLVSDVGEEADHFV